MAGIRGAVAGGLGTAGAGAGMSLAAGSVWNGASFMAGDAAAQAYQYGQVNYAQSAIYGAQAGVASYAVGMVVPYVQNAVAGIGNKFRNSGNFYSSNNIANTAQSTTDFYVRPNGDVIPATGYRYIARNTSALQEAQNGRILSKTNGMYFSFDKYDDAIIAQGKLQIPYRPEYRISFNTLDIIDDIYIPYGKWGRISYDQCQERSTRDSALFCRKVSQSKRYVRFLCKGQRSGYNGYASSTDLERNIIGGGPVKLPVYFSDVPFPVP